MVELDNNFRIEVSIGNASAGKENITLTFANTECSEAQLTPHEARILATELISAVHRAEVRSSLREAAARQHAVNAPPLQRPTLVRS